MIFWDTSAFLPLLVLEPSTERVRAVVSHGEPMVVWWGSATEAWSALCRRQREGGMTLAGVDQAKRRLLLLSHAWHEIVPSDVLRDHTMNVLGRHALKAADALQIGAALTLARGRPNGVRFATFDQRLALAARGEGFDLVFPLE